MGYIHLPKSPDTINSNPNIIRAIATKAMAVITPEIGSNSAIKPSIIAIIPTIVIPVVPRDATAKPANINAKATSQPRATPPTIIG